MKKTNKLLAAVLSLMMLFQSAPFAAFAESPDSTSESFQIGIIDNNGQEETDVETDETVKYRDEIVPKTDAEQISIDVDYVNDEQNALGEDYTGLPLPAFEEELDLVSSPVELIRIRDNAGTTVYVYNKASALDMGYASSMALMLMLVLLMAAVPYLRKTFREQEG